MLNRVRRQPHHLATSVVETGGLWAKIMMEQDLLF